MSDIPKPIHSDKQKYYKNYYNENKEKLNKYNKDYQKTYYKENKSKFKDYYKKNKEQRQDYQRAYSTNSMVEIRKYQHDYYIKQKKIIELKGKTKLQPEIKIEKKQIMISFD